MNALENHLIFTILAPLAKKGPHKDICGAHPLSS